MAPACCRARDPEEGNVFFVVLVIAKKRRKGRKREHEHERVCLLRGMKGDIIPDMDHLFVFPSLPFELRIVHQQTLFYVLLLYYGHLYSPFTCRCVAG